MSPYQTLTWFTERFLVEEEGISEEEMCLEEREARHEGQSWNSVLMAEDGGRRQVIRGVRPARTELDGPGGRGSLVGSSGAQKRNLGKRRWITRSYPRVSFQRLREALQAEKNKMKYIHREVD